MTAEAGSSIAVEEERRRDPHLFRLRNLSTRQNRSVKTELSRICASVDVARTQQSREVLARAIAASQH